LATAVEVYQEDAVARLFTTTTWLPATAAALAVALATLEFVELVVRPRKELSRLFRSFSTVVVWVLTVVISVAWLCSVVSCACHCTSGPRAAVRAVFTAEVTSIPTELEPVDTCSSEPRSIPLLLVDDVVELDPNSDDTSDEDKLTELITNLPLSFIAGTKRWRILLRHRRKRLLEKLQDGL
jgi:hypothetical protein